MAPSFGRRTSSAAASTTAAASAAVAHVNNIGHPVTGGIGGASSSSSSSSGGAADRTAGTLGSSSGSSNAAIVSPVPPLPLNKNSAILRGGGGGGQGSGVGGSSGSVTLQASPLSSSLGSQIHSSATAMVAASSSPPLNTTNGLMGHLTQSPSRSQGRLTPNSIGASFQSTTISTIPLPTNSTDAMMNAGAGYRSMDSSSIGDTSISPNASPSALSNPTFHSNVTGGGGIQTPSTLVSPYYAHGNHSGMMDQQSIYSATNTIPSIHTATTSSTAISSSTPSDTPLKEVFTRRIRSIAYIKKTLSASNNQHGTLSKSSSLNQPWLDIVRISRQDLDSIYNSESMRKRAQRYFLLGCSLACTIELTNVGEFARGVLSIMQEAESTGELLLNGEKDKTKMKNFFKSSIRAAGTSRKSGGSGIGGGAATGMTEISHTYDGISVGGPSISSIGPSGIELIGSHVPFPLDFLQTTITFCDILMEIYCKFSLFLNASSSSSSTGSTSMMQGGSKELDGMPTSGGLSTHESLSVHSYGPISGSSMECMQKVDGKVKKMLMQICKELDGLARGRIRDELASIDPLMARDIGIVDSHTPMIMTAASTPNSGTPNGGGMQYLSANSVPMTTASISAGVPMGTVRGGFKAGSIHSNHPNMYTGSAPNLLATAQHSPGVNAQVNLGGF